MILYVFTGLSVLSALTGLFFTLRYRKSGEKRNKTIAGLGLLAAFVFLICGFILLTVTWGSGQ